MERLSQHVAAQGCALIEDEARDLMARQLRLEGAYVLHSETAKKNGGDFDFDWICVVEEDRFPRFVKDRFSRGLGAQQGKNKANKATRSLVQSGARGHEGHGEITSARSPI